MRGPRHGMHGVAGRLDRRMAIPRIYDFVFGPFRFCTSPHSERLHSIDLRYSTRSPQRSAPRAPRRHGDASVRVVPVKDIGSLLCTTACTLEQRTEPAWTFWTERKRREWEEAKQAYAEALKIKRHTCTGTEAVRTRHGDRYGSKEEADCGAE